MGEQIARFKPGENVPGYATADVTGGHFVKLVAGKDARGSYSLAHCGAGEVAFGVCERDAIGAVKDWRGGTNVVRRGAIARVVAGAAIAAPGATGPVPVKSDATGRAITQGGTGAILGYACHAVAAAGEIVEVDLL